MNSFFGIDSSNYTSSAAVFSGGEITANCKRLLPVEEGELGLRQSAAIFHHVKNLPGVIESAMQQAENIAALGVSTKPRNAPGSYMPCFLAGKAMAKSISSALGVPLFGFSHQAGHIMAALYSAGRPELVETKFIAFHVSGGTTEAVLVSPDPDDIIKCEFLASSLDLKAGQAVDRTGKLLGLNFPAGAALDPLAAAGKTPEKPRPVMKGADCCLSGIENKCAKFIRDGLPAEDVARYCIDSILAALDRMTEILLSEQGDLPLLFAGGVMSNSLINKALSEKYGALFAAPEFSSDNAAGIAILAGMQYKKQ